MRDWLTGPVWSEPPPALDRLVAAGGPPWGAGGRWVLTNGPDSSELKERLYAAAPLLRQPPSGELAEGAGFEYLGPEAQILRGSWERVHTGDDGFVDWSEFCNTPRRRVAVAATVLEVDQAEWRRLMVATTGPALLFVGGRLVGETTRVSYMEPEAIFARIRLGPGTTVVAVATWQVGFRECRHILRLSVLGLPVRVVVPSAGADEESAERAERLLERVGVARWGSTRAEVPLVGPEGALLEVAWRGQAQLVRLNGGRAEVRLPDAQPGGEGPGGLSMVADGGDVLRVRVPDPRAPVARSFPVARLCAEYRGTPQGGPETWRAELLARAARLRGDPVAVLARAGLDSAGTWVETADVETALSFLASRSDGADFEALALLQLWNRLPAECWESGLRERVRGALLGFKYWIDQPGLDAMCYFTENHQFVWHVAETLAGEAFPSEVFSNRGWPGAEHAEHGRRLAREWLVRKLAGGFSEFDSNAYLAIDLFALVSLIELGRDPALAELAAGVADRVLFSLATNSWRGIHGSAHGRSYVPTLRSSRLEETAPILWCCFGMGALNDRIRAATVVATARRYQVPEAIRQAAVDARPAWVGRQRYRGGYRMEHDLLEREYASDVYVYRTPDGMIASVQDYRVGLPGLQEHVWGATLGPETQVFANHAANSSVSSSARPNAWAGNRILPRARQHLGTVLAIYRIPPDDPTGLVHAWFPAAHFDEWRERGSWIAGRVGDGYVAVSTQGGSALQTAGPDAWQELRGRGGGRVWVCTLGRRAAHGSFEEFLDRLDEPAYGLDSVVWQTPDGVRLALDWSGPFLVDGRPDDLDADGRLRDELLLENPFARLAAGDRELVIGEGDLRHTIDLSRGRQL